MFCALIVPQAYFLENVLAAGARDTLQGFYRGAAGKTERPTTCLQYIENKNMEGNRSVEDSKPYQVFAGDVNTKNCRGGRGGHFSLETEHFRMGFRVLRKELLERICKM